jgi:hypothetical protein
MTATEDQLRALLAERAGSVPALPEAGAGVHRAIRRRRRQYAAAGMAGVTLLGAAAAGLAAAGGSDHVARPASRVLTTIRPESTGFTLDRDIVLPSSGLAFRVDCQRSSGAIVIRIDKRWLGSVNCAQQPTPTTYGVQPAAYRALRVAAGGRVTLSVDSDSAGWAITVTGGPVPRAAEAFGSEPTSLPPDADFRTNLPGTLLPARGRANGTVTTTVTLPTPRVAIAVQCVGAGRVTATIKAPDGRTDSVYGDHCGLLGDAPVMNVDELTEFGLRAGERVVVSVTASGFDTPTWRAALLRVTRTGSFVPLTP